MSFELQTELKFYKTTEAPNIKLQANVRYKLNDNIQHKTLSSF
jgi:hypothetical protein